MKNRLALVSGIILLTLSTPAMAQLSKLGHAPVLFGDAGPRYRMHAYMGGQLMGIGAVDQTAGEDQGYLSRFGGGIGLFGGVRLSPHWSLEGNWTFALHDEAIAGPNVGDGHFESIYLMSVTADVKVHLPTNSPMEPYLQVGGGLLMSGAIHLDDRVEQRPDSFGVGAMINAGVGLDLWVTRHISMGARVLYRGMAMGEAVDEVKDEQPIRNFVHGISVDAFAAIHF